MALGSVAFGGGGINSLCIARELAVRGWKVSLADWAATRQGATCASTGS